MLLILFESVKHFDYITFVFWNFDMAVNIIYIYESYYLLAI